MTATSFLPGRATAYVTDDVVVVADAPADGGVMSQCVTSTDWDELVEACAGVEHAAILLHRDDDARVGVIGDITADVEGPEGVRRVAGTSGWSIHELRDVLAVTVRVHGADGAPTHRVDAGIVPASVVSRRLVGGSPVDPFDALFGLTTARSVEDAAVRCDERSDRPPATCGVLLFSTGERVVADRTIVLGRNPRRAGSDESAPPAPTGRFVTLARPTVSRRHAIVRVDGSSASIEDLGSANGTWVSPPGGDATPLRPGEVVDLVPGAVVELGGDVSFALEEVA